MIENASGIEHNPQARSGERGLYLYQACIYTYEDGQTQDLDPKDNYYAIDNNYNVHPTETGTGYAVGAISGTITIGDKGQGIYKLHYHASFGASRSCRIHMDIFINGVEDISLAASRDISSPNDFGHFSLDGPVFLQAGDVIDVRYESDTTNTDVNIDHANLNITRTGNMAVPV